MMIPEYMDVILKLVYKLNQFMIIDKRIGRIDDL